MKRIVCEVCESSDIIKDGNVFVCRSCGCKYSLDEVKNLMREVPEGTAVPNQSAAPASQADSLLTLARRAKEQNDSQGAANYYQQLVVLRPNDWEANFYATFFAAHNVVIAEIGNAANRVGNAIGPCLTLLKQANPSPAEREQALNEIIVRVGNFKQQLIINALNHLGDDLNVALKNLRRWVIPALGMMVTLGDKLSEIFEDYDGAQAVYNTVASDADNLYRRNGMNMTLNDLRTGNRLYMATVSDDLPNIGNLARQRLSALNGRKREKDEREKKARVERYWIAHPDELARLERQQADVEAQLRDLDERIMWEKQQLDAIEAPAEYAQTKQHALALIDQMGRLGVFKLREKRVLQSQIDELDARLVRMDKQLNAERERLVRDIINPLMSQRNGLLKQLEAIRAELTRDR